MSKLTQQLILLSPHTLQNRVETLKAQTDRKHESLPTKLLAWTSVLFSLFAVGLNIGFSSLTFILLALSVAIYAVVIAIRAWWLRSNLRDSTAAASRSPFNGNDGWTKILRRLLLFFALTFPIAGVSAVQVGGFFERLA